MTTGAGPWTPMDVVPDRPWPSAIATVRVFRPLKSPAVAWNEKVSSPATASPCVPSSKKDWLADPTIGERSATTVIPVLVGFAPGVTATVSNVVSPGLSRAGLAEPVPEGFVDAAQDVRGEKVLRGLGLATEKSLELL